MELVSWLICVDVWLTTWCFKMFSWSIGSFLNEAGHFVIRFHVCCSLDEVGQYFGSLKGVCWSFLETRFAKRLFVGRG